MTFRVGQKVVCVNDHWRPITLAWVPNRPKRLNTYIVRGFYSHDAVWLEEINNGPVLYPDGELSEPSFYVWRFRPVIEHTTDISFTEGAPKDSEKFDNRRRVGVDA